MVELREQEERLRFIISRVDSEILRFQKLLKGLESKESELSRAVTNKGLEEVPINVSPHSSDSRNLREEVKQHIMDLNKLKNYVNIKLELVMKEEELLEDLMKRYGRKVSLHKLESGEFEINYNDEETEGIYNQIKASRKMVDQLRDSIKDVVGE